jgi:hypothetical protein
MQRKNKSILSAVLFLSLGAILIAAILIVLNHPGAHENIPATGLVSSPEPQVVYPAPHPAIAPQAANDQAVYPQPASVAVLPTNTAIPANVVVSPTAELGSLTAENVQRTSLQDAKAAYDGKEAIFLDVRTAESYARNHVPGAISIPEAQIIERIKELDPNQWIIAYCS